MKWNNVNVLVTGGAGLIGSRITAKLLEKGANVKVIDNISAYPFDQPQHFGLKGEKLDFINGDIANPNTVFEAVKGVDVVFHEAAFADVAATIWNPAEDFRSNIQGTFNMLKTSLDLGVNRFVFASSAAVYGDKYWSGGNPPVFKEDAKPEPLSTYANSKLWGELEAILFNKLYGLKTTCLRYFSVYGVPQVPKKRSHSWVATIFAMRAITNQPMLVFGDGLQVRDFIHVNDIADATIHAAESEKTIGEVLNVGGGAPTSVKELAELTEEIGNFEVPIEFKPRPKGDPLGGYADINKMQTLLDWKPQIKLKDGIHDYIQWCLLNKHVIPEWI